MIAFQPYGSTYRRLKRGSGSSDFSGRQERSPMGVFHLREEVGFACRYDLEAGLREYVGWRRANDFLE